MKASELIAVLQTLQNQYGDLECVNPQDDSINVEFNDDESPVFVFE